MKQTEAQKHPQVVKLPRGCVSPTGSIYRRFDIVMQTRAVSVYSDRGDTVRCSQPFILSVKLTNGKIKQLKSR